MTPGTQPIKVKMNVITMLPQPLSYTANGGNNMLHKTLQILIFYSCLVIYKTYTKLGLVPKLFDFNNKLTGFN